MALSIPKCIRHKLPSGPSCEAENWLVSNTPAMRFAHVGSADKSGNQRLSQSYFFHLTGHIAMSRPIWMSFIENVAAVVAVAPEIHGNKPINTAVHSTKDGANMGQLALSSNGSNAIQQYTAANQGSLDIRVCQHHTLHRWL